MKPNDIEHLDVANDVFAWTRAQIEAYQNQRLGAVADAAKAGSSFWRDRLPPGPLTVERLGAVPPLTKDELMANWDSISVVGGLTRTAAEAALDAADGREVAGCRVHGSSGSSGRVAVMANGAQYWADVGAVGLRHAIRHMVATGQVPRTDPAVVLMGDSPRHGSFHTLVGAPRISPRTPDAELLERLAALQPALLLGLTSQIDRVARAIEAGSLALDPDVVLVAGEPLDDATAARIVATFPRAFTSNLYASTEVGPIAQGPIGEPLEIDEDRVLVEVVDDAYQAVPLGTPGTRLLVTPLYGRELPLFRYELNDEVALAEPGPSALRRIRSIAGRSDDAFRYGDVVVHPNVFRAVLTRPAIVGYQVRQTPTGAAVNLRIDRPLDTAVLTSECCAALRSAGLADAEVTMALVDTLPNIGAVEKLQRFVALPAR